MAAEPLSFGERGISALPTRGNPLNWGHSVDSAHRPVKNGTEVA